LTFDEEDDLLDITKLNIKVEMLCGSDGLCTNAIPLYPELQPVDFKGIYPCTEEESDCRCDNGRSNCGCGGDMLVDTLMEVHSEIPHDIAKLAADYVSKPLQIENKQIDECEITEMDEEKESFLDAVYNAEEELKQLRPIISALRRHKASGFNQLAFYKTRTSKVRATLWKYILGFETLERATLSHNMHVRNLLALFGDVRNAFPEDIDSDIE
jgi:hypothetical protein